MMTTNALPSFRFEIDLRVIEAKLDDQYIDRETNPERDTKELLRCKVSDIAGGEEYSHHGAGRCDAEKDCNCPCHPSEVENRMATQVQVPQEQDKIETMEPCIRR